MDKYIHKNKNLKHIYSINTKLPGTTSFSLDFCFLLFAQTITMMVNKMNIIPPAIPATIPVFRDDDDKFEPLSRIDVLTLNNH